MQQNTPTPLGYAKSFTELAVYQKTRVLAREVFGVTKKFPREEAFSLTDQWRRASRSVGGQIAEAWAKRRYVRHFITKLTDADGEQQETQHWTIVAFDCGYITRDEARRLGSLAKEIGRMLGDMMQHANSFCDGIQTSVVREDTAAYFVEHAPSDPLDSDN